MRLSTAVAVASLLAPVAASAQDLNYDDSRVGQRGLGLAGAFVGLADDASAAYYNPGGLALQPAGSAVGSLAVSLFQGYTVQGGYRTLLGSFDLDDDADPSVPTAFAFVVRLGQAREDGLPDHALAVFYGRPTATRRRYTVDAFDTSLGGTSSLNVSREDYWTHYAASYAYRAAHRFGLGVTVSFVTRRFRHEEFESLSLFVPTSPPTVELSASRRSLVELDHLGLVFRIGSAWDVSPRWRLGLVFQPPSIGLKTTANVLSNGSVLGTVDGTDLSQVGAGDVDRPGAESPLPWELRVGAAHQGEGNAVYSFAVGVYGRQGSSDDPVRFLGDPQTVDPSTGFAPRSGLFVADAYHADYVFQANVGAEFLLADRVPLQVGLRSDLSAAPPVPERTNVYQPDRIHGFGASLSVGLRTSGGDIAVGGTGGARFGQGTGGARFGQGLSAGVDRLLVDNPAYQRTDVRAWSLLIFITGSGRAAASAAGEVYDNTLRRVLPVDVRTGDEDGDGD